MAFLKKICHLDQGPDLKFLFFENKNCFESIGIFFWGVQLLSFLGPGPGTARTVNLILILNIIRTIILILILSRVVPTIIPGPDPKFFSTWTGDRPQGFTVDKELKLELEQEVIVVTRCHDQFKKRCILVPGSKSKLYFLKKEFKIYFFWGEGVINYSSVKPKIDPIVFLKLNKILPYSHQDRGASSKSNSNFN